MVQEKDAAKKREQARRDFNKKMADELEAKTKRFTWVVSEKTLSVLVHDEYDSHWTEEKVVNVSNYFDTESDAVEWMGRHEPDRGKELVVRRARLIEEVKQRWVWY